MSHHDAGLNLCCVIPTFNEVGNIVPLTSSLKKILKDVHWEIIFVDDNSSDGTFELIESLGQSDYRIRLIKRFNRRGLSSAVIEGMMATCAPYIAVMDADLQHDETLLPNMLWKLSNENYDIVIASRKIEGGASEGLSFMRERISHFSSLLARKILRTDVQDVMSGYFMLKKEVVIKTAPYLSGIGFKILADIMASSQQPLKSVEIAYHFRERNAGVSKLDLKVASDYLLLLIDKKLGRWIPARMLAFMAVGSMGALLHFFILWLLHIRLSVDFVFAQLISTMIVITFNFSLNNIFTYSDLRLVGKDYFRGWLSFMLISFIGTLGNVGIASYVFNNSADWKLSAFAGILIGVIWNYSMTRAFTWHSKS